MQNKCPTCGAPLKNGTGAFQIRHLGEPVYFCGLECMRFCRQHPDLILGKLEFDVKTLPVDREESELRT